MSEILQGTTPSLAMGLAYYYQRAAVAVTTTDFPAVALTLQDQNGNIIKNECFEPQYVPTETTTE